MLTSIPILSLHVPTLLVTTTRSNPMKLFKPQFTSVRDGNFSVTALLAIGIRFRIVLSHHHLQAKTEVS